jgi:predicted DNA-binding transcriptional regulator AlpA
MATATKDDLLTAEQLAAWLQQSIETLNKKRGRGDGPPYLRLSGAGTKGIRYRRSAVEQWLAAREVRSTSEEAA